MGTKIGDRKSNNDWPQKMELTRLKPEVESKENKNMTTQNGQQETQR